MKDRNDVIEVLEYLISEDCTDSQFDYYDDIETAVALLKEQEAVKPIKQIEENEWTVCGCCKNHIVSKWSFCPYCGKAVKWK